MNQVKKHAIRINTCIQDNNGEPAVEKSSSLLMQQQLTVGYSRTYRKWLLRAIVGVARKVNGGK